MNMELAGAANGAVTSKKPKLDIFLNEHQPEHSYYFALQRFMINRQKKDLSVYSLIHLYDSLWKLGKWLDNKPVMDITGRDLKRYRDDLHLRYAVGTIRPVIGDIRQFFRWCKKKRFIHRNPTKRLAKPRSRRSRDKAASETAVFRVIAYLVGKLGHVVYRDVFGQLQHEPVENWSDTDLLTLRDLFIVAFLYETGGRAKELSRLGARIMQRECQEQKRAHIVTSVGKTNDRDMRFTEATAELWRIWYAVRPTGCDDYAIFSLSPNRPHAPLTSNGISQMLARRCREVGTAVFRAHALRHAKVRRARKLVGLEMASLLIDHSSVEMTRNYANVEDEEIADAVAKTGIQSDIWAGQKPHTTA